MKFLQSLILGSAFIIRALADVDPIIIDGNKFFYKTNGTQFYIRGIAYQEDVPSGSSAAYIDPLADSDSCQRDIPYISALTMNTIRVYAIDPNADHTDCMQMLADAGIYVILDLSAPNISINRADPAWDVELFARYTAVIDAMAGFNNMLGFFAGNEVSNNVTNTDASAFVKAAIRDSKAYIKAMGYRTMGVGYSTNDDADIRDQMADYFNCGDQDDAMDFYGINNYEWCGDSSFESSGYQTQTEDYSNFTIPVFFSEYGCNTVQPRTFTECGAIYGPDMDDVWSGGIVYMYFQETNDYGVVTVEGNSVTPLPDYTYLSQEMATNWPSLSNTNSWTPTNTVTRDCPAVNDNWQATATPLPPTPNYQLCHCMVESLSCIVSPSVDEEDYGELFGTVCGSSDSVCEGITANGTTGVYGAYSMCDANQTLSWALNQYYIEQDSNASACDFSGQATLVSSTAPTGACSSLMGEAGAEGTGTVTSAPDYSSVPNSGSGSLSGDNGDDSESRAASLRSSFSVILFVTILSFMAGTAVFI